MMNLRGVAALQSSQELRWPMQIALLLVLSCCELRTTTAKADAVPVFLFAGQSNGIGRPHQAGQIWSNEHSINGTEPGLSLETLLPILTDTHMARDTMLVRLCEAISKADVANNNTSMVEATALLDISERYPKIWSNLANGTLESSYCSITGPRSPKMLQKMKGKPVPQTNGACGKPWGSELLFSHVMAHHGYSNMAVPKLMAGATQLKLDWMDVYWPAVQQYIQTPLDETGVHPNCNSTAGECSWTAFVWYQGETETVPENREAAENYYSNLVQFVSNVRQTMHQATPVYNTAQEIPVVIVKLNHFFTTGKSLEGGRIVLAAQERFVREDLRAFGVDTDDLSHFYHMDAASNLVLGDRIARVLLEEAFKVQVVAARQEVKPATPTFTDPQDVRPIQLWIILCACAATVAKFFSVVARRTWRQRNKEKQPKQERLHGSS